MTVIANKTASVITQTEFLSIEKMKWLYSSVKVHDLLEEFL